MTPRSDRGIKPLSDSVRDIMRFDSKDLNPVEHELRAALAIIVNRYDDVYAPQIDSMESDIREILDKVEGSAQIMKKLADKVAKMPTNSHYRLYNENISKQTKDAIDAAFAQITFPRLLWKFFRSNKWNAIIGTFVLFILWPYLQFIAVTLFSVLVEKTLHIDLITIMPFLKQIVE